MQNIKIKKLETHTASKYAYFQNISYSFIQNIHSIPSIIWGLTESFKSI